MKKIPSLLLITTAMLVKFALISPAFCAELVHAKDGSGVAGYTDTPILPWCSFHVHDPDRPAPKRIDPGPAPVPMTPPSGAIVLFDGKDLSQWDTNDWKVVDGCIEAVNGNLMTKDKFGSCQIHVEWMTPVNFEGSWYNRGNNGVFLMGLYEIQIFDSYNEARSFLAESAVAPTLQKVGAKEDEKIYPDGQAAAVYGQTPPLINVCRKPGEWQSYDIVFTAPQFDGDKLVQPARVTMFHNGVLVHLNQEIYGETGHRILPQYKQKISKGPLRFAGHHCPVRFRNVWLRPL